MSGQGHRHIMGWRMDLVRLRSFWKGAEHLKAKLELFTLLAKSQHLTPAVEVCIVTDSDTWERCYKQWLQEEGLLHNEQSASGDAEAIHRAALPGRFKFHILDIDRSILPSERESLSLSAKKAMHRDQWLKIAEEFIAQQCDADDRLSPDFPPDYLLMHQQTESDAIAAIGTRQGSET